MTDDEGSAKKVFIQFLAFRAINYVKSGLGRSLGSEMLLAEAEVTNAYTSVIEEVSLNEMIGFIESTLASLPPLSQKVFEVQTWKCYSVKQTASLLGVSEKTVRTHYIAFSSPSAPASPAATATMWPNTAPAPSSSPFSSELPEAACASISPALPLPYSVARSVCPCLRHSSHLLAKEKRFPLAQPRPIKVLVHKITNS